MPPISCPACKQKMSSEAAVCPHCGARQTGAPSALADVKLSPDEIRALIAVDTATRTSATPQRTSIAAVVLPHARTSGGARVAELALTLVCLPLLLSGLVPLALGRYALRRRAEDLSSEAAVTLMIAVSGGLGLASIMLELGGSAGAAAATVGAEIVALIIRNTIRARAAATRDLMRLAKDD